MTSKNSLIYSLSSGCASICLNYQRQKTQVSNENGKPYVIRPLIMLGVKMPGYLHMLNATDEQQRFAFSDLRKK
jgi:hypothetical protein